MKVYTCEGCGTEFSDKDSTQRRFCSRLCYYDWKKIQPSSLLERFWRYLDHRSVLECWPWGGTRDDSGYGVLNDRGTLIRIHCFSFELHHRPLLPGEFACHSCDNPPCGNPGHLFAGSHVVNMADARGKRRMNSGSRNHHAVLNESKVAEIKARMLAGERNVELAREFGIVPSAMSQIRHDKLWMHVQPRKSSVNHTAPPLT